MPARINIIMNSRHERWKIGAGKYNAQKFQERLKAYFENPTICKCCQKPVEYKLRRNKFCGHSCSAKFTNKERIKNGFNNKGKTKQAACKVCNQEITISLNASIKTAICNTCKPDNIKIMKQKTVLNLICENCNQAFKSYSKRKNCSLKCRHERQRIGARKGGLKSAAAQSNKRRSKNESYFAELCSTKFKNVLTNIQFFNDWDADVILPDLKIAILWNGPWHYKKITKKHSVAQVQNRDRIKINETKKCGYEPYVIKDIGSENKEFVEEQFKVFLEKIFSGGGN